VEIEESDTLHSLSQEPSMRIVTTVLGALAVLTLLPSLAQADCAGEPKNLLAKLDCGFEKGTTGWSTEPPAAIAHDPKNGDPSPGALLAKGGPQGSVTVVGPCLPAQPSVPYSYAGHLRLSQGNAYFCTVQLFQYTDGSCGDGGEPLGAEGAPPEATWRIISAGATTGTAAGSIEVRLVCSGEPDFAVLWDDVWVVAP
jgi:hypothetical protein